MDFFFFGRMIESVLRLWHSAEQGRDNDVVVYGGSRDYILVMDSVGIYFSFVTRKKYILVIWLSDERQINKIGKSFREAESQGTDLVQVEKEWGCIGMEINEWRMKE